MMRSNPISLLIAALLVFGACGTETRDDVGSKPDASPEPVASAMERTNYEGLWKLVEGTGPEGEIPVEGWDVTGHIQDGWMFGDTGCNDYGMRIKVAGTSVSFGRGSVTQIGCPPSAPEEPYLEALRASTEVAREGELLVVSGPESRLVFQSVPPAPAKAIVGRVWHLVKLIEGPRAMRAEPATLHLQQGGRFEGSTGCRELSGTWLVEGDRIMFTEMGADGRCSPRLQEQDGFVINTLGDGFNAEVHGKKLTVFGGRSRDRLLYRASR